MRHLHLISPMSGSIGEITKDLFKVLDKEFIITQEVKAETPIEKDILLCHFIDQEVVKSPEFNNFKKKILIQPIDGTKIKQDYINSFNRFDLIIVPAYASKNILRDNGVKTDIKVIPNFFKPDLFEKPIYSNIEKELPTDKIIFYHESTFHPRKGIDLLYEGYIRAFSGKKYAKEVLLVLKDNPFNKRTFDHISKLKKEAISLQKKYRSKERADILKFSSQLEINDLKTLWNRCNAYVSFAKIEGFGLPMLRHLLLKKPILCLTNYNSGYHDYLSESDTYFVDSIQTTATGEFMDMYSKETTWATSTIDEVVESFRKAYVGISTRFERKRIKNLNWYNERFGFEHISKQYIKTIQEI